MCTDHFKAMEILTHNFARAYKACNKQGGPLLLYVQREHLHFQNSDNFPTRLNLYATNIMQQEKHNFQEDENVPKPECLCISPLLVYLCIYSFHIYSRSLNVIAFHPLLFAFLLFSHLRLTRWRMAAPSWDSESMLIFKTSRFPRCVLVHFFRLYFLFVKAS